MEVSQNSVTVALSCGELTCAAEALTTFVLSALVRAHLVALGSIGLMLTSETRVKSEHPRESDPCDAEEENSNDDEGDEDAVEGGLGEGEEDLSSEDDGDYANNTNKSNPKKNPEGAANAPEENGEDEDEEDGDGDDGEDDEDDDDDGEDDDDEDADEEEDEEGVEEEEENEDEEDEDEDALQPPKKRKK